MPVSLDDYRRKMMEADSGGAGVVRNGEPKRRLMGRNERVPVKGTVAPPADDDFITPSGVPIPSKMSTESEDSVESVDKRRLLDLALKIEQWAHDPWVWIRECVKTQDEADENARVKPFPDKRYLEHTVRTWQREPILAIPKSRRMVATWLMIALHLHKALFFPRSAVFIQSKKEEDSDFLLGPHRMLFIYHSLPPNVPWPRVKKKYANLAFDNGSYVKGIAQGADQLRQYTATAILCDEMAFWEDAESTWTSLKPTIQGGGKVTMLSSAQPGFFQRIVEGRLRDVSR